MELITGEQNKTLRQKSLPVEHINERVHLLIDKMKQVMAENNGIGLAAIQLGQPERIIVCRVDNKDYVFINPVVSKFSKDSSVMEEGCLSLPNNFGEVERPSKITLKALDLTGKKVKMKAFGLLARVIQHEADHLDGILFIDKAREIKKETKKNISF